MVRASKMRGGMPEVRGSKWTLTVLPVLCFTVGTWALIDPGVSQGVGAEKNSPANSMGYAGSVSCRECHERFYQLWSTSKHGLAMVNESTAYARLGETKKADESLQKALKVAPGNGAANFNMGLLKAEQNHLKGAEKYLKAALKADPQMAQAAYNLCVIVSKDRVGEGVTYCEKAVGLRPQDPRHAYTLAFYLNQKGSRDEAVRVLKMLVEAYPQYKDAEMLLKDISRQGPSPS
jgi:tetratricopeptide (TPR) repeat protein